MLNSLIGNSVIKDYSARKPFSRAISKSIKRKLIEGFWEGLWLNRVVLQIDLNVDLGDFLWKKTILKIKLESKIAYAIIKRSFDLIKRSIDRLIKVFDLLRLALIR